MEVSVKAREIVLDQWKRYPQCEIDDFIKALYQAAFGCGHFAPKEDVATRQIHDEIEKLYIKNQSPLWEPIGERFARVHLAAFSKTDMDETTLARLFMRASKEKGEGDTLLQAGLDELIDISRTGEIPLDTHRVDTRIHAYLAQGCPALHHSERFRVHYAPAYRLVRQDWAQLLALFERIDMLLKKQPRVLIALDGASASGKSTLAALLKEVYDACVVHMDDFFLQPHQRVPQRLAQPGGNVDYERFSQEVLAPLRAGDAFNYRVYDCKTQRIRPGVRKIGGNVNVVEGAYSLHPAFKTAYDLRVVLTLDPTLQRQRIVQRNGSEMLEQFIQRWIPLENAYFEKTQIRTRCDMIWHVSSINGMTQYTQEAKA